MFVNISSSVWGERGYSMRIGEDEQDEGARNRWGNDSDNSL